MKQTIMATMEPKELVDLISEAVLSKLVKVIKVPEEEKVLTRKETALLLKISESTLRDWVKREFIHPCYIGGKVYFKKSDIIHALEESQLKNINI